MNKNQLLGDVRFWLILGCLIGIIGIMLNGYPL